MLRVLELSSENVFVPLTVGGGIRDYTDAEGKTWSALDVASQYFRAGADKVCLISSLFILCIASQSLPRFLSFFLSSTFSLFLCFFLCFFLFFFPLSYDVIHILIYLSLSFLIPFPLLSLIKVSIGSDAVYAVEKYLSNGCVAGGTSCLEIISRSD